MDDPVAVGAITEYEKFECEAKLIEECMNPNYRIEAYCMHGIYIITFFLIGRDNKVWMLCPFYKKNEIQTEVKLGYEVTTEYEISYDNFGNLRPIWKKVTNRIHQDWARSMSTISLTPFLDFDRLEAMKADLKKRRKHKMQGLAAIVVRDGMRNLRECFQSEVERESRYAAYELEDHPGSAVFLRNFYDTLPAIEELELGDGEVDDQFRDFSYNSYKLSNGDY